MIIDAHESFIYDGTNAEEVIKWAQDRGEYLLVMFEGHPTFFYPSHRIKMIPGERVVYNKDINLVSVKYRQVWYNEKVENF